MVSFICLNREKKDREILDKDIEDILINGEYGTLSTISNNGYPYIVPLNYIYYDDSIYFTVLEMA